MCIRYLAFFLLIWCPGALPARSTGQGCRAPPLDGGYFFPKQETYSHGAKIAYACDNGLKPAVEGWWARSTCEDGSWSGKPQCIDENVCLPPTVPNGEYGDTKTGWYEHDEKIRVKCNSGYKPKGQYNTAHCQSGNWSSIPICERDIYACSEPPKIPNAIITEKYKDVYAADSKVQYECEDEYMVDEQGTKAVISCIAGNWTTLPVCEKIQTCSKPPEVARARINQQDLQDVYAVDSDVQYLCDNGYTVDGKDTIFCSPAGWSAPPTCTIKPGSASGGSASAGGDGGNKSPGGGITPGSTSQGGGRDNTPQSDLCFVNTANYPQLVYDGSIYLLHGETVRLRCLKLPHWYFEHYTEVDCNRGLSSFTKCCNRGTHFIGNCGIQFRERS